MDASTRHCNVNLICCDGKITLWLLMLICACVAELRGDDGSDADTNKQSNKSGFFSKEEQTFTLILKT